ncbi:MAG: MBL fold metallo-hydrolase [Candidatus Jordarchaeales archaeon]
MSWLVFYGGVGEIGGNKILLEDGDTRIFLDFGVSFSQMSKFYSAPFLTPRRGEGLVELGLLPRLEGVYTFDESQPSLDAVVVSHVHMDHAGFLPLLKEEIPILCGETTAVAMEAFTSLEKWVVGRGVKGGRVKTFRTGSKLKVGSVEVVPVHVDHSVPGSYGFIIHASEGTVAYTGDFRMHGARRDLTEDFVSLAEEEGVDVLVTEATNILNAYVSSEREVEEKLDYIVSNTEGLVVAYFASTDIDRLRSFYNVAKRNGRKLILSAKQAYLLNMLHRDTRLKIPSLKDENLMVFKKRKKQYTRWEEEVMGEGVVVEAADVSRMQREAILVASLYDFEELIDVKPIPGSCYIYSSSEPFSEEMEIDMAKMKNWLDHYGLPQYSVHVSGHVMPIELKKVVARIKPKTVFPVHCEQPEAFARFVKGTGVKVAVPAVGEKHPVRGA